VDTVPTRTEPGTTRDGRWRPSAAELLRLGSGLLLLLLIVPGLPQVIRAADAAAGVRGTFTVQSRTCLRHPGHATCNWQGDFRSHDGSLVRTGIFLYGNGDGLAAGARTAARDVERAGYVYPLSGSREWLLSALLVGIGLLLVLSGGPFRLIRRGAASSGREPDDA
jgi:hypothetical protein